MASKKKEPVNSLAGWSDIILNRDTSAIDDFFSKIDKDIEKNSLKIDEDKNNQKEAAELFHKLWVEAYDSPNYNKENWNNFQLVLNKLNIKV